MTIAKFKHLPTLPSLLKGPQSPFIHRDLSWLQFNERVLSEARASAGNPLLERTKFLAISATNLDEFFMIRFASFNRSIQQNKGATAARKHLLEVRSRILETIAEFGAKQAEVLETLSAELAAHGVNLVRRVAKDELALPIGKQIFEEQVFAALSPPVPFKFSELSELENLQMGIYFPSGLWVRIPKSLPPVLSRVQRGSDLIHYFFLDDLLRAFLGDALKAEGSPGVIKLTRDSDFTAEFEGEEDPASIPDMVRKRISSREKGAAVRIQYQGDIQPDFHQQTMRVLKLVSGQLYPAPGTLCLQGLWAVVKQTPPEIAAKAALSYAPATVRLPKPLQPRERMFERIRKHDFLLHHPYDSFQALVEWLSAASEDAQVESIEMTIYRADAGSPLIEVLKKAASVKRVRVIIELRARFDEMNNLSLADELRKSGVEVGYGFGDLKLHAKIACVTRKEAEGTKLYTHLSTGNYNTATAKQYTDLAILTADPEIGHDARIVLRCGLAGAVAKRLQASRLSPRAAPSPLALAHRSRDESREIGSEDAHCREG